MSTFISSLHLTQCRRRNAEPFGKSSCDIGSSGAKRGNAWGVLHPANPPRSFSPLAAEPHPLQGKLCTVWRSCNCTACELQIHSITYVLVGIREQPGCGANMSLSGSLASLHSCHMRSASLHPLLRPRSLPRPVCRAANPVVAAAEASEKRPKTKASDFKGMSQEQIDEEVRKEQRALFDLRIAQRTKQVRKFRPRLLFFCLLQL